MIAEEWDGMGMIAGEAWECYLLRFELNLKSSDLSFTL